MENGLICQTKHFLLHVISRNCPNLVSSWASDRNRQLAGDQPRWAGIGLLWKYKIHNTKIQNTKIQNTIEHQTGTDSWLGINSNGQELDHYGNKKYKNTKHKQEPFWKCILKPTKRRRIHQFEHSDKCCWNAKINWHWHHVNLCLEWS